jgi:hypothetical protein
MDNPFKVGVLFIKELICKEDFPRHNILIKTVLIKGGEIKYLTLEGGEKFNRWIKLILRRKIF